MDNKKATVLNSTVLRRHNDIPHKVWPNDAERICIQFHHLEFWSPNAQLTLQLIRG